MARKGVYFEEEVPRHYSEFSHAPRRVELGGFFPPMSDGLNQLVTA